MWDQAVTARRSNMKSETKKRLRAMSTIEKEKRLDQINRKLEAAQLKPQPMESLREEIEEREWLKKKLGYNPHQLG